WDPPTASPRIKHVFVILQDGRSFDSYFGQYCQSELPELPPGMEPPICEGGAICCHAMPASIAGAAACAPIGSITDAHVPKADPDCMRSKIAGGALTGFAQGPACANPLDFACAGPDSTAGTPADYWDLTTSALADNFFQTYAYADGPTGPFS